MSHSIFISFQAENEKSFGYTISNSEQGLTRTSDGQKKEDIDTAEDDEGGAEGSFEKVFNDFVSTMESYRRFIPFTLNLAPEVAKTLADRDLRKFAEDNGKKRKDLSNEAISVYELDAKLISEVTMRHERIDAAVGGARVLPQVMVIGLVSAYDSFLAALLRVVVSRHEEIVLTSQKQLTFEELMKFSSIEEARSSLIEREIETVLRQSHHDQFDWMQDRFKLKLKDGLSVWPKFVELCERRNLFTHTGGLVSRQYLNNCVSHKADVSGAAIGKRLGVGGEYFTTAVSTVYEVGLKLCFVFWRKFSAAERDKADSKFNGRCMELISAREYVLAEALLSFSKGAPGLTDEIRRMMIVNFANAVRLQGRTEEAAKIVEQEDWSATSEKFRICVASVKGDIDAVLKYMDQLGKSLEPNDYRIWPVFRETRKDNRFIRKFEEIFGEPFALISVKEEISVSENSGKEAITKQVAH